MTLPQRKPNRLKQYDYSSHGAYFVTICTESRKNTLCTIVGDGLPVPKRPGEVAAHYILEISNHFPNAHIDHYVVMPNHIHLLLFLKNSGTGDPSPTLGNVIGWFKYQTTKQINLENGTTGAKVFQRSYHDHVVRNEQDYLKIWEYIENNPARWQLDCFYHADVL